MISDTVRELLQQGGVRADDVVWAEVSERPPTAPSHRWVAWPTPDDEIVLGGTDRGRFAAYARFGDPSLAAEVLQRWIDPLLPPAPRDPETLHAAALAVSDQLGGASGSAIEADAAAPASVLPVGTPLDHIGNASGHVLHLYDTALSARSVPPTDADEERMGFVLNTTLPDACRVTRVEPWFGQPGGGLMVVLDRVIAYYVDTGALAAFAIPAGARDLA